MDPLALAGLRVFFPFEKIYKEQYEYMCQLKVRREREWGACVWDGKRPPEGSRTLRLAALPRCSSGGRLHHLQSDPFSLAMLVMS